MRAVGGSLVAATPPARKNSGQIPFPAPGKNRSQTAGNAKSRLRRSLRSAPAETPRDNRRQKTHLQHPQMKHSPAPHADKSYACDNRR